jgi:diguanylate cyclase (GGDEF)-like protein
VASVPGLSYAFQPMLSTRTGRLLALEALARPDQGTIHDLLRKAARDNRLVEVDAVVAAGAVRAATTAEVPLHVNVLALTASRTDDLLRVLLPALKATGRRPADVTVEVTPPFGGIRRTVLLDGLTTLREQGFRIAFDGAGDGDLPLSIIADVLPDMVKLDAYLLQGVPGNPAVVALIEALGHLANRTGIRLAAVGVESEDQLAVLSKLGVPVAQGNLMASAQVGTPTYVAPEITRLDGVPVGPGGPLVADLVHPALTMPESVTSEEVRQVFLESPEVTSVILVDSGKRPRWSLDRSRFLLAVTGPYGHALHASKPAARHADAPRTIRADASTIELLEAVGETEGARAGDDVVVVDPVGRCAGIVRLTEVMRGVAEAKVEQAVALNPLTRLPGTDTIGRELERRIERGEMFVVSWLDVDAFKQVNDTKGFAAGDDLIRAIGRALADLAARLPSTRVAHVGGDDFLVVSDVNEIGTVASAVVDHAWTVDDTTVSVSLASLVCAVGSVETYREASRLLAPLKKRAKEVGRSSWVLGRPKSARVDVLRGRVMSAHAQ